jgi:hypothetical protein
VHTHMRVKTPRGLQDGAQTERTHVGIREVWSSLAERRRLRARSV